MYKSKVAGDFKAPATGILALCGLIVYYIGQLFRLSAAKVESRIGLSLRTARAGESYATCRSWNKQ